MESVAFELPNIVPETTIEGDMGIVAGLSKGFFAADEDTIVEAGCPVPEIPMFLEQAEAMLPMAKVMIQNMNGGVVPHAFETFEGMTHEIEVIVAVMLGDLENQFCTGSLLAFEYKKIFMGLFGELFTAFMNPGTETLLQ